METKKLFKVTTAWLDKPFYVIAINCSEAETKVLDKLKKNRESHTDPSLIPSITLDTVHNIEVVAYENYLIEI